MSNTLNFAKRELDILVKSNDDLNNRPRNFFTLEKCKEEALKCSTKKEWREKFPSSCAIAFDKGWFEECSAHMENMRKSWTKEMCLTDAILCSSKKEWKNKFPNSYSAAQRNHWANECSAHMKSEEKKKIDKKFCIDEAKKHNTLTEWAKSTGISGTAYRIAKKNNWIEECINYLKTK